MKFFIEADSIAFEKMSGVGHATLEIIRAMDDAFVGTDHEIHAIIPFGRKPFVKKYNLRNVHFHSLPPGYKYVNFLLTRTGVPVPMDLLYGKGVYIFPNYKTWYVPFSKAFTFVHDVAFKIFPEGTHPKNLLYLEANFARWLKRADIVLCISHSSASEVAQFFPQIKDQIEVVYLGVDLKQYYPRSQQEVEKVLADQGIDEDYFLYIGNIEPRKNILNLLKSYERYCGSVKKPAQLVVIGGDGWKNETITDKIKSLQKKGYGVVRPPHYVEDKDLPALFTGARALVHIALHEGFGLTPIEAQACGTKLIVSDIPVLNETLQGDIVRVPTDDIDAIASAMKTCKKVDIYSKTAVESLPTWNETADKIVKLAGLEL